MAITGQTRRGAIPAWGRAPRDMQEQRAALPRSTDGLARVVTVFATTVPSGLAMGDDRRVHWASHGVRSSPEGACGAKQSMGSATRVEVSCV